MTPSKEIVVPLDSVEQLLEPCPPSPFRRRRIREEAEKFLLERVAALPREAPAKLLVSLPQAESGKEQPVADAVHEHFNFRRIEAEKELQATRRFGWRSLAVALLFLIAAMFIVQLMKRYLPEGNLASVLTAGLTVFAWVALWRPCELLLYEWYPFKRDARVFRKLEESEIGFSYDNKKEDLTAG
jgi:hypothetical protein